MGTWWLDTNCWSHSQCCESASAWKMGSSSRHSRLMMVTWPVVRATRTGVSVGARNFMVVSSGGKKTAGGEAGRKGSLRGKRQSAVDLLARTEDHEADDADGTALGRGGAGLRQAELDRPALRVELGAHRGRLRACGLHVLGVDEVGAAVTDRAGRGGGGVEGGDGDQVRVHDGGAHRQLGGVADRKSTRLNSRH